MQKGKKVIIAALLLAMMLSLSSCGSSSGSKGNGTSSCKNCGRKSVYAIGYCKRCYESFNDWMGSGGGR
ncbi:MAG: hypothetical protein RR505_12280 [Raoultibacter sp.]